MIDRLSSIDSKQPVVSAHFIVDARRTNEPEFRRVKDWVTTLTILALLSASIALAEDFKTVNGKEYKDATISRVEADGIVLKTKTGIAKVYFVELPKNLQERFHYGVSTPVAVQSVPQPIKQQPKRDTSGWAGALPISFRSLKLLAMGGFLIIVLVVAIVRRRS